MFFSPSAAIIRSHAACYRGEVLSHFKHVTHLLFDLHKANAFFSRIAESRYRQHN